MVGKVKFYLEDKGYGFIIADEKEYFVNYKSILQDGRKKLNTGDVVDFDITSEAGKEQAINVSLIQKAVSHEWEII